MAAPSDHYALVGPLWSELEQALVDAGGTGDSAEEMINSLRAKLSRSRSDALHYVRMERNALQHRQAKPLTDSSKWERLCRESISDLRPRSSSATVFGDGASGLLFKVVAWGFGAYIVLRNERLMELLLVGGLCYCAYKLFFSSKK